MTDQPVSLPLSFSSEHAESVHITIAYFAQYGSTSGHLRISLECISFQPLLPAKGKDSTTPKASKIDATQFPSDVDSTPLAIDKPATAEVKSKPKTVNIAMIDVVGIRKRDKTSLLVVVAAGLEIECLDGTVRKTAALRRQMS